MSFIFPLNVYNLEIPRFSNLRNEENTRGSKMELTIFENIEREIGGSKAKEHYLKLDAAKEVDMLERKDIGKTYRK